jgi:hypothetical protein
VATQYDSIVQSSASQYGVDPSTMLAIYQQENGPGNPNPPNAGAGAVGLMQVLPSTALTVDPSLGSKANAALALQNPTYNAQVSAAYLAKLQSSPVSGSLPVTNSSDLAAAYYAGGVYKDPVTGAYTTRSGGPGAYPGVQGYANQVTARIAGGGSSIAGSSSGSQSAVSPHAIPDQLGKYTGIDGLYQPLTNFNVPSPFLAYVQVTIGGEKETPGFQGGGNLGSSGVDLGGVATAKTSAVVVISPDLTPTARKIRVVDFCFTEVADGAGTFVLKLFVETSTELNILAYLVNQQISLTWGYQQTSGTLTRSFNGKVLRFTPQFRGIGFDVLIEGIDLSFAGMNNAGSDSYAPVTGRVSDIVSWIAAQHGWATVIEETIPLYTDDSPHKTTRVFIRQTGQTEMSFINNTLCPVAMSALRHYQGGAPFGKYRAYFQQDSNNPQGALHFHSISADASTDPTRTYVYGGLSADPRASVVKDFIMQYNDAAFLEAGIGQLNSQSVDPTSGQVTTIQVIGQRVIDYPIGASHNIGSQDSVATVSTSAKTQDEAQAKTLQKYLDVRDLAFRANLVILGDPFLRISDIIHVTVQRPGMQPQLFYNWSVIRIAHTIAGGEYTLNCDLMLQPSSSLTASTLSVQAKQAGMTDFANQPSTNPPTGPGSNSGANPTGAGGPSGGSTPSTFQVQTGTDTGHS